MMKKGEWKRLNKNYNRYKIWLFIKAAYMIAQEQDNFQSCPSVNKKKVKWQNFRIKGSPKGILFTAREQQVQPIKELVKEAINDIQQEKYSSKIVELIEYFENFTVKKEKRTSKDRVKQYTIDDIG